MPPTIAVAWFHSPAVPSHDHSSWNELLPLAGCR